MTTADELQTDPRISALTVYRRDGTAVGHNTRGNDGRWGSDVPIGQMITTERQRSWTIHRSREWLEVHHNLSARMDPTWQKSLRQAWNDAQPVLAPSALATIQQVNVSTRDWDLLTDLPSPTTSPQTDNTALTPEDTGIGPDPPAPDPGAAL